MASTIFFCQRYLPVDFLIGDKLEGYAAIHIAVGALIVSTSPCDPQQEAVGFGGRAEQGSVGFVKK